MERLSEIAFCLVLYMCAVWLFTVAGFGQRLPVKNYTTADGLANDFVGEIVRDSRGFLWFCTGEGLSRFDGYEFKNYTQAHGLSHRSVNDLLELENEIYLVATDDGIAVFNPLGVVDPQPGELPVFRTIRADFEPQSQKPVSFTDLRRTRKGEIWAASEIGLFRVLRGNRSDDWRLEKVEFDLWRGKFVEINSTEEDRFGRLWLGTGLGLFIFNPESGVLFQVPESPGWSIVADEKGRVWSGGAVNPSHAVHLFELMDADSPPIMRRHFTKADGLTDSQWIHALFKTSDGRVLAGIRNGLNEFQPDAPPGEPAFRQLFSADIVSIGEDAGGNIWVGTATRGTFKLTRRGFTLYQITEKPPYGGVTSIFAGGAPDEIFVASSENDLLRFDGEGFVEIQLQGFKSRSWSRSQLDFRSRVDGDWWFPTAAGLARYAAVQKFEDLARAAPKTIYRVADGLHDEALFNLYEDSRGDVWISRITAKNRLMRWERNSDKIRVYSSADGIPENTTATAFAEDLAGNLWFGFYAGGSARLKDGKFRFFSTSDGFPNGYVTAIHTDRSGRLWFGTNNSGAVRLDNPADDEPRFTSLNVGSGLSSNLANCITEDNYGRIYVGTARGINRIEPETGRLKYFTQADGLPGNSIGRCARDADGNLWFSQKFTLARLNARTDEKTVPPVVYIANLRVNGEAVRKLSELGETTVENLAFASDKRQIQIDFFAVGFGTGETLRYQYKFEGGDADWSEPGLQRTINLNLAPGKYDFIVRAINAEGSVSERPARVSFSIARPYWQQWWFLAGAAFLVSSAIYALYRYRIAQIVKLEQVRTRIATDLHDDLGASLSKIAILSEIVNHQVAPVAKNPEVEKSLTEIAGTSREMVDSMADIVWVINPERDRLSDLIGRMRGLANEMTELGDINLKINLLGFENRDLNLGADLRREIYLIFKETLNNLVKHSHCENAEIEFRLDACEFIFTVIDDGQGFNPEKNGSSTGRGGNGLINMRKRAKNLGGNYRIESKIGTGTIVTLSVSLKQKFSFVNLLSK
jgi:signal transduction histidine kinase/ligand-binding sensor domain-containing protein